MTLFEFYAAVIEAGGSGDTVLAFADGLDLRSFRVSSDKSVVWMYDTLDDPDDLEKTKINVAS